MSGTPRSDAFLEAMRRDFPGLSVVMKDESRFCLLIDRALKVVTLGGQRYFLDRYHTVIGRTLYLPASWRARPDVDRLVVLRHERVHLEQFRRYGLLGMSFLYLVPFAPLGLAYGRARLEWEAYEETLRATAELRGPEAAKSPALREHVVAQFTGSAYGWMWPFPKRVNGWYDRALAEILGEPWDR